MSNVLRKLERNVIKSNIKKEGNSVKRNFEQNWQDFRDKKYVLRDEDGNIISDKTPRNTMPKKQHHFDNYEQYNKLFAYMNSLKKASKEDDVNKEE